MDRWRGKVAVVTGASSGIGLATAKMLKVCGVNVIGLARNAERMENEMKEIGGAGNFFAKQCDITKEDRVKETFKWIEENFKVVNILVNSAGRAKQATIADVSTEDMTETLCVNVLGLLYCTRAALRLMMKDETKESHIINVNSTLGHKVNYVQGIPLNVYPATKFAVTALCQSLIQELNYTKIKVTSVSPGIVSSNFLFYANVDANYISMQPALHPEDVASSILHVLSSPKHVQITEITLVPAGQRV